MRLDLVRWGLTFHFWSPVWPPRLQVNMLFYFVWSRRREFQVNPRNPAKFTKTREIPQNSLEILPNTRRHNIFESYLGCWDRLLAANLLIYLETSSLQRVNNIPKLPGVLKLNIILDLQQNNDLIIFLLLELITASLIFGFRVPLYGIVLIKT